MDLKQAISQAKAQRLNKNQKGFTLVEIAIVLVIIGLLLAGVLKGQELIENTKVKSVISDFDAISAAYYAHRDRTSETAGDSAGDGVADDEAQFWGDLRTEGFLTGDASDASGPQHALNGVFSMKVAADTQFSKPSICASQIGQKTAYEIDLKIDDGNSDTGLVRSIGSGEYDDTATDNDTVVTLCKQL